MLYSQSAKFCEPQAKQGRDLTASILILEFWNFRFRAYKYYLCLVYDLQDVDPGVDCGLMAAQNIS